MSHTHRQFRRFWLFGMVLIVGASASLLSRSLRPDALMPDIGAPSQDGEGHDIRTQGVESARTVPAAEDEDLETSLRQSAGRIALEVLWANGEGAGGTCGMVERAEGGSEIWRRDYRTDATGRAVIGGLSEARYRLKTHGESRIVQVVSGEATSCTVLLPEGLRLRGRVLDPEGDGVSGARIWMSNAVPGRIHDGAPDSSDEVRSLGEHHPMFSRSVSFADGTSGILRHDLMRMQGMTVARTNASGEFELRGLPVGRYIGARVEHFGPSTLQQVLASGADDDTLVLVLSQCGGAVSGQVVDADDNPIPGAMVVVGNEQGSTWDWHEEDPGALLVSGRPQVLSTDEYGRFACSGVACGTTDVRASADGFSAAQTEVRIQSGVVAQCVLTLVAGGVLTGQVLSEDGLPIQRPLVEVIGRYSRPRKGGLDGTFELHSVPVGEQLLVCDAGEQGRFAQYVQVDPGENESLVVTLERGRVIRGRVRWEDGSPGRGLWILGKPASKRQARHRVGPSHVARVLHKREQWVATDSEGRFRLVNCVEVPYVIEVRPDSHWTPWVMAKTNVGADSDEAVEIGLSESRPWDVWITGQVDTEPGADWTRFRVEVRAVDDGIILAQVKRGHERFGIGKDGTFRAGPLPRGSYIVKLLRTAGSTQGWHMSDVVHATERRHQCLGGDYDVGVLR